MTDEEMGMPAKRELSMRQLRHLLRLHHGGVSAREIGRRLGVARSTIQGYLRRATAAGLTWPVGDEVTDDALEQRLFGRAGIAPGQRRRAEPDWAALARELKRPGVTMTILWYYGDMIRIAETNYPAGSEQMRKRVRPSVASTTRPGWGLRRLAGDSSRRREARSAAAIHPQTRSVCRRVTGPRATLWVATRHETPRDSRASR